MIPDLRDPLWFDLVTNNTKFSVGDTVRIVSLNFISTVQNVISMRDGSAEYVLTDYPFLVPESDLEGVA